MAEETGVLKAGAARVWKYQRALWWWFFLNFLFAQFGAWAMSSGMAKVTEHSLFSDQLYNGFNVAAFAELAANPETGFGSRAAAPGLFAVVFFFVAIFLTGGILEAYRAIRKLSIAEFFSACGQYFWRWIRLLIFTVIVMIPVGLIASGVNKWSSSLSGDSPVEKMGFYVLVIGMTIVVLLAMIVRLWFDMAQVRAVAIDERAMRRSVLQAFKLTFRNFGSLFWLYFRISFLAWLWLAIAFWIWTRVPGQHVGLTIFLFELTIFWLIATRLWQRASETVWYERYAAANMPVMSGGPDYLLSPVEIARTPSESYEPGSVAPKWEAGEDLPAAEPPLPEAAPERHMPEEPSGAGNDPR